MLADPEVKTDDEIYQAANEEWLGILSRLWIAFDKPLDAERLTIYQKALDGLPLGLLDLAVNRVIREHTYNNVPTIAEVWAAVRNELGKPHDLDLAIRHWCDNLWSRAVVAMEGESA